VSDEDAMPERGDGLHWQGEKSENVTNEANFDETMIIAQTEDLIAVAPNSCMDSGLDKREKKKDTYRDIKITASKEQTVQTDRSSRSQSSAPVRDRAEFAKRCHL
jgi:hypothetical protein